MAKYDIFISYSRKDSKIADRICNTLDSVGISYFIDRQGIGGGMEFPMVLATAINDSTLFLFLASKNAYESKFINSEVTFAFNKKPTQSILPYIIDDSELPMHLQFIFSSINWRNITQHPIETILKNDLCAMLGKPNAPISSSTPSESNSNHIAKTFASTTGNTSEINLEKSILPSPKDIEEWYLTGKKYHYGEDVDRNFVEAMKWYHKAAQAGHSSAQYSLAEFYCAKGEMQEGLEWYLKAANQGNYRAQYELGFLFYYGKGVEKDRIKAEKWYLQAAEGGYYLAQKAVGDLYYSRKEYGEAGKWYRKAAEQGDATAQWFLGKMYEAGDGIEKDYLKALQWFLKSAEQGDADAQYSLGDMYYRGLGVKEDYAEALQWFLKSAEQDNSDAQFILGKMYEAGDGVEQDYTKALQWYVKVSGQGDFNAQFKLGEMYLKGKGVEKNYEGAVKWFLQAAEQGYADAQFKLGEMYLKGKGVEKNYEGAVKWFLQAAEQGHADAQYNLGTIYFYGTGVEKNIKEAQKWYSKAAEQGHKNAEKHLRMWVNRPAKTDSTTLADVSVDSQNKCEVEGSDRLLNDGNLTKDVSDSDALNALTPKWDATITEKQKSVIEKIIDNMVYVEGGEVELGATSEQLKLAEKDEKPSHWIRLSSYWIDRYVVTQEEWQGIMNNNPSKFQYHGEKNPVESISFEDCEQFVKELKRLSGINFALPSEAQWEFAARGGMRSQGYIYSGSDDIKEVAWSSDDNLKKTQPVGLKLPNELGLYDMSGNVAEWCDDVKGKYTDLFIVDPQYFYKAGFWDKGCKVRRGGSFSSTSGNCRVTTRNDASPDYKSGEIGVRLVIKVIPSKNKAIESKEEGSVNKNLVKDDSKSNKKPDRETTANTTSVEEKTTIKECPDNKIKGDISSKSKGGTSLKSAPVQSEENRSNSSEAHSDDLVARWSSDITDLQKETINNIIIKNMVYVEGGELMLGATPEQLKWADKDEKPAHKVRMSPYYICRYPVTQKVWEGIMNNNPSKFKGPQRPVESITFNEAQGFVDELKRLSGIFFALPSEAQWEFAARGGVKTRNYVYAGSNDLAEVAKTGNNETYKVGTCKPNELGLYGMSGNVSEWCDDSKGKYTDAFIVDPQYSYKTGFWTSEFKVYRGGSYLYPKDCRVSYRASGGDTLKLSTLGLRLIVKIISTSNSYNVEKLTNSKSENISPK